MVIADTLAVDQDAKASDMDGTNSESSSQTTQHWGCAPYLQIFRSGQLMFTTTPTVNSSSDQQKVSDLPFCSTTDGPISFAVDMMVQGDVLIRCRHVMSTSKSRVSMFRAAFHTGYVPTPILRLKKWDLDGACHDHRFADDFYVDVIFETVQA